MSHFCSVAREHPDVMVCLMPYDGVAPQVASGGTVCKTTFGYVV